MENKIKKYEKALKEIKQVRDGFYYIVAVFGKDSAEVSIVNNLYAATKLVKGEEVTVITNNNKILEISDCVGIFVPFSKLAEYVKNDNPHIIDCAEEILGMDLRKRGVAINLTAREEKKIVDAKLKGFADEAIESHQESYDNLIRKAFGKVKKAALIKGKEGVSGIGVYKEDCEIDGEKFLKGELFVVGKDKPVVECGYKDLYILSEDKIEAGDHYIAEEHSISGKSGIFARWMPEENGILCSESPQGIRVESTTFKTDGVKKVEEETLLGFIEQYNSRIRKNNNRRNEEDIFNED